MGIRPKLFLLFFALGVLPVLLLSLVNYWYGGRAVEALLRADVERDALGVARAVEARELEQESGLMALARTRSLRDYVRGGTNARTTPAVASGEKRLHSSPSTADSAAPIPLPEDVRAVLGAFLLENQKYYTVLTCLDTDRRPLLRVETNWHATGERVFDLESLRFQTGDFTSTGALPDERVWDTPEQRPLRSPILRESSGIIVRYTVPVFTGEAGEAMPRGALVADLKLDSLLKETVGSLAALAQSSSASTATLTTRPAPSPRLVIMLDHTGRILYHTNEALIYHSIDAASGFKRVADAMMAGESGWQFYDSTEGSRWLAVYHPIAPLDFSVTVAGDYTAAAAGLHRMGWISVILSALIGLVVAFLLSKLVGRTARSIERVTEDAVAIAGGNLNQRIEVRSSDETHLLAESFNRMSDRLREQIAREAETRQFQAFMRLSAMLTHDLKNAISSLSLLVSNMERQFHNEEFRIDAMRSLKDATTKLRSLVARLSEPVESLSGEFQRPRATDLIPIIKRVLATTIGPAGQLHEVETLLPFSLYAKVDAARLEKVIENLILNALEAMGSEKGRLTIEAGTEKDDKIFFSISDTGPGMSEDFQRTRLFRPFATTKSKGIGLGLYTCREVIRAHGGQIDVKSQKDTGTTFRVVLPSNQITEFMATRR
ncbi:MAG TPA: ATP-binding protein [Pyrinomonadaceae bacterium]